ncbi:ABC transporter permease [Paenibacillus mucilaginosus]|uniref:ABC transporter permease n=2 Tax=Paenibacillus mucilaginosus TaxID=61624 RepID=I0BIE1_9BACL|nr:ABC transporter permease [Paenibacillus mucilaginosus]AEI41408.1 Bacitracin transport permease protein BcrB [Paenibacillus mucilaginosus KNP414]AFH62138.1 ABC transporter permease [Paenibacillus mucilaginosus K02]MCG7217540.1 ABC transporter permease [Paenibacillus mucilaginosus]WDM31255.1 ABC transporter permease [Paenibacillus mucilaginosus]
MVSLYPLIKNECIKIIKKKRLLVVLLILAALIPMFTYAQLKVAQNNLKQFGTTDWRVEQRQKIRDYTQSLSSGRVPEEWKQWRRVEVKLAQYYLDKDVNPAEPNGVTFTREFVKNAVGLFIPLMVMVIAADMVSGEHTGGTIKLLLTRPVQRWKVLLSKLLALVLFTSFVVIATGALCYLISGIVFGYGGWDMPIFFGFQVVGTEVDFSFVRPVEQWLYLIMEFGLVWYSALVVALMTLMVSVLVRSTAAGMGIMLAVLISGTILTNMVSSWETARYLFMVNLNLTMYLSGALPPIKGMTLPFSLGVLTVWGLLSVIVSFAVFTKKDVLN